MRRMTRRGCGCLISLLLIVLAIGCFLSRDTITERLFPQEYQDYVEEACGYYDIDDPWLIMAMIREESHFDPQAESSAGACGLMQLMPDTAQWIIEQAQMWFDLDQALWDPRCNIWAGVWYIHWLEQTYYADQGLACAIAAYNAGHSTVDQWLAEGTWDGTLENVDGIPYAETRQYVQYVYKSRDLYEKLYK